jgi:hypothetical protein
VYQKNNQKLRLTVHCDSDFSGDRDDAKSTTGYVISLNGCSITWRTTKQKATSTSTVEAEYIAACAATKEVVWIQYLLTEILGLYEIQRPILFLDSAGAEAIIRNNGISNKTKHIRYSYHFVRECHANNLIDVSHIEGKENPADMFTKPLSYDKFREFRSKIRMSNIDEVSSPLTGKFTERGYLKREEKAQRSA